MIAAAFTMAHAYQWTAAIALVGFTAAMVVDQLGHHDACDRLVIGSAFVAAMTVLLWAAS